MDGLDINKFMDELSVTYKNWEPSDIEYNMWRGCVKEKDYQSSRLAVAGMLEDQGRFHNAPVLKIFKKCYARICPQSKTEECHAQDTNTFVQYHGGGHCDMKPGCFFPIHCRLTGFEMKDALQSTLSMYVYQYGGDWRLIQDELNPVTYREMAKMRYEMGGYPNIDGMTALQAIKMLSDNFSMPKHPRKPTHREMVESLNEPEEVF